MMWACIVSLHPEITLFNHALPYNLVLLDMQTATAIKMKFKMNQYEFYGIPSTISINLREQGGGLGGLGGASWK